MFEQTSGSYGVNEFTSVLGSVVFSFFAIQPLCIVNVTGPNTVRNSMVYMIMKLRGTNHIKFMCCICLWSMVMRIGLTVTNAYNAVKWVTRFCCDIFG